MLLILLLFVVIVGARGIVIVRVRGQENKKAVTVHTSERTSKGVPGIYIYTSIGRLLIC